MNKQNIIASTAPRARQLTEDEIREIEHEKTHYPYSQAVGLEALKIVQKYQGWVSDESMLAVAEYLDVPVADLEGVATFFNLIYRKPVGKNVILFCDSVLDAGLRFSQGTHQQQAGHRLRPDHRGR